MAVGSIVRQGWRPLALTAVVSILTVPVLFPFLVLGGLVAIVAGFVQSLRAKSRPEAEGALFWSLAGVAAFAGPLAYVLFALVG